MKQGIADPRRLGVTGVSYGGFMTSWLITQDSRFAAAVPVAPVTNQVTEHLIGNIPHFVTKFLADKYANPGGKYFERSPIMHVHKAKTPTLNICGARDRCTPPEEAVQFHNALLENGVNSALLTYPEEGALGYAISPQPLIMRRESWRGSRRVCAHEKNPEDLVDVSHGIPASPRNMRSHAHQNHTSGVNRIDRTP